MARIAAIGLLISALSGPVATLVKTAGAFSYLPIDKAFALVLRYLPGAPVP